MCCAPTRPCTPWPVMDSNSAKGSRARFRSRAAARMAAASGCSLDCSSEAAMRSTSCSVKVPTGTILTTRGFPSVSVPVLSMTSVSDLLQSFQRFGGLDEHAERGALADADLDRHRRGQPERAWAGDDEHGDRRDQPVGEGRRQGPRSPRRRRRAARPRSPRERNRAETRSAMRWIGARLRCASATMATMRASTVSAPIFSARMISAPVPLTVPPTSAAPGVSAPASTRR